VQLDTLAAWSRRVGRRPPDPARGPAACLHTLSDDVIATMEPQQIQNALVLRVGKVTQTYPAGTPLYVKDIMTLLLIQENLGKRPIYFALTAGGGARMGLDKFVMQQGLVFKLMTDSVRPGPGLAEGLWNSMMDVERTRHLMWSVYKYSRLFEVDSLKLEPTTANIAGNLSFPFLGLGQAYLTAGQTDSMLLNFRRAQHLAPSPEMTAYLRRYEVLQAAPTVLQPESARRDTGRGRR